MIRVVIWEEANGSLNISTDVHPMDAYVEIPEKLYESYLEASRKLYDMEKIISMFAREQERQRAYQD